MARRPIFLLLGFICVGGLLVIGGVALFSNDAGASDGDGFIQPCAAEPPADFADPPEGNETIGWFDGYWYNEPLDIDTEDGITQEELERLSKRTAARFEALRCITFDRLPPVEIMTREEFANQTEQDFAGVDESTRLFDNAKLATLLTVGHDEDSIDVRMANRQVTVGGYYNFVEEHIAIITDDPDRLLIDEEILAHELGHAVQDQWFNLEEYNRTLHDVDKGKLGVIEGDVHLIEHRYLQMCEEGLWEEECLAEDFDSAPAGELANWALYFMNFQPYSDGPAFIEHIYDQGGWDAVNALYDEMPDSSTSIIHPETYGEATFADLEVNDRSDADWERLTFDGAPDYQVIGEGGMASIFFAPPYETNGAIEIIPQHEFLNLIFEDGETQVDPFNPVDYEHDATDGWVGDRLYVYSNDVNDTAAVWKIAWEDESDLDAFLDTYEQLIEYRQGERKSEYDNVYVFDDQSNFDMAMVLHAEGDRLWIVTAPTVNDLDAVHADVEFLATDEMTPTPTPEPTPTDTPAPTVTPTPPDEQPGFGVVVAIVAITLGALLAVRRR